MLKDNFVICEAKHNLPRYSVPKIINHIKNSPHLERLYSM
jgi:hypothetical protein